MKIRPNGNAHILYFEHLLFFLMTCRDWQFSHFSVNCTEYYSWKGSYVLVHVGHEIQVNIGLNQFN